LVASGDGDLVFGITRYITSLPKKREVVSSSIAGSTSRRLNKLYNPLVADSKEEVNMEMIGIFSILVFCGLLAFALYIIGLCNKLARMRAKILEAVSNVRAFKTRRKGSTGTSRGKDNGLQGLFCNR